MLQVVAIDGISGSGKRSTARLLAQALGFRHLDTGAMYRMLTMVALGKGVRPDREPPDEAYRFGRKAGRPAILFPNKERMCSEGKWPQESRLFGRRGGGVQAWANQAHYITPKITKDEAFV